MVSVQHVKKEYCLGNSEAALLMLEKQGQFFSGLTRDLLVRAGIGPGMRVLDFGSGAGDVSILASELVGSNGEVVAIERDSNAIEHARLRIKNRKIHNIRFVQGDESVIPEIMGEKRLDALVGRNVLCHQPDPIATFCNLVNFVRPGGIVAFHDMDPMGKFWSIPSLPLFESTFNLALETFRQGGAALDMRTRLVQAFDKAGITDRRIISEGLIETGPNSLAYEWLSSAMKTLLPLTVKMGLTTQKELDIETLADRLRDEAVQARAFFTPINLVGAFGHTKG
jgi:ubiquinone/menaquinone biosynthesis C-methylase UbiE